jgi:hypothetical protein
MSWIEFRYILFLLFRPCNWGTPEAKREDTAPKASVCFLGGAREIFGSVSEDLLGGTGKAEDAKLPGAGIIPKLCPMQRVKRRQWTEKNPNGAASHTSEPMKIGSETARLILPLWSNGRVRRGCL